ncbi:ATP-dependent acyl-CoA ligase [Desulfosarcina widdelii]|uniref:ATP-dependent acyl-CoA ligase n=1 Tax=Desulfosarcina widdelii TaxID=947919 RepID=A0A5K7Z7F9_9BACT|nr:AMP-binding protein [Desulfosarcina widdelii]BBO77952.1 ATP-dependent acyl-CoA ligase [Desulfosarcina widdelii]
MSNKAYLNQAIVSHLIEMKAEEKPDREILVFENGDNAADVLTYRSLYENSNKIARLLLESGLEKGDTYAVFMRNHAEFAYCMLAGPVIGVVMVPIDPRSRGSRLRFLLSHAKAKAVFVSGELLPQLEEVLNQVPGVKNVFVVWRPEQDLPVSDAYPTVNETLGKDNWEPVDQQIMEVRHPMQIIYTSGTTGDPKGVMIRNNRFGMFNIVTKLVWKYKPSDVLYTGLSLTHGNAQAVTLFPAIGSGIKAVFSSRFTKSRIWDICRNYGCTSFSLLGGMMAGIFNEPVKENDGDNPVKTVISAGTPAAIWQDFESRFQVKILEWYGAVEGGFAYKPPNVGPVGSFGKPIPGMMQFKVVDDDDREVAAGQPGELICRMMKGDTKVDYLDNAQASEEKTRGGWLRTGDIVSKDEKGWFFFKHRKGSELRRAGDFIQPDHIERVIGEHPDVSEVCVYGVPAASGAPGESDLVAALAPFDNAVIDPGVIFDKCRQDLEPNFVPTYLQLVDVIPKTISEKALDRVLKEQFSPEAENVYTQS